MSGLSGSLEAVGLRAIVGFLAGLKKSGRLRLSHDRWWGEVVLDRGDVVGAAFEAEQGLAALDAIALAFPVGTFNFVDAPAGDVPASERNVELAAPALQARLEAMLGGRGASPAQGFTLDAVPQVVLDDPGASEVPGAEKVALSRSAIQTLLAVDGRRSVAEVAAGRGYADTIRDLQTLARQGLIALPAADPIVLPGASPERSSPEARPPAHSHRDAPAEVAPAIERPAVAEPVALVAEAPVAEPEVAVLDAAVPQRAALAAESPVAEPEAPAAAPARWAERGDHTCPKLGFADDAERHFSRPTQLHRCFAGTSPQRIATDDQQDFCLTGLFPACARFAAGATSPEAVPDSLRPGGVAVEAPARLAGAGAPNPAIAGAGAAQSPASVQSGDPDQDLAGRTAPTEPSETGNGVLVAPVVNGAPAPPPAAPTLDGPDRESLWTPAPLVAPAAVEHVAAGGLSGAALAPSVPPAAVAPDAADAPTQVVPYGVPRESEGSDASLSRGGRQGVAGEPGAERVGSRGARTRPAGPGLLEQLRGSRTRLMLALAAAGIGGALLVPVLMRAPANTPAPTPGSGTSTGSTPPAAGGTAPAGTPRALRTVFDDRFVSSQGSWPNNPDSTAWFADGAYRLFARQPGQFVAIGAPLRERFRDVIVTGAFRKVGGPTGGGYGLIVRDQGAGARDGVNQLGAFYVFEAGDKGEIGIWRRDGDRWIDIVPWSPSNAVSQGNTTNTLSVQAIGQQLSFSVNGQVVSSRTDGTLQEGLVGIFVGGDNNEVVIERFVVQLPG